MLPTPAICVTRKEFSPIYHIAGIKTMTTSFTPSGGNASRLSEMAAFDNIQVELDKIQQGNVITSGSATASASNSTVGTAQIKTLVAPNASGNFVQGTSLLTNSQTNQVVFSSGGQQLAQAIKRPSTGQPGPTVAKVIIRNTGTGKQQIVPISGSQNVPGNTLYVSSINQSPTKTITISAASFGSPQKLITSPATPTKQIVPLSKLPISPLKTPPKITMIPVSLGKSPQRSASGQMVTMLGTKPVSMMSSSDSKPTTITMSPSKVLIKGQPVTMVSI